jgi:hypothetical protein
MTAKRCRWCQGGQSFGRRCLICDGTGWEGGHKPGTPLAIVDEILETQKGVVDAVKSIQDILNHKGEKIGEFEGVTTGVIANPDGTETVKMRGVMRPTEPIAVEDMSDKQRAASEEAFREAQKSVTVIKVDPETGAMDALGMAYAKEMFGADTVERWTGDGPPADRKVWAGIMKIADTVRKEVDDLKRRASIPARTRTEVQNASQAAINLRNALKLYGVLLGLAARWRQGDIPGIMHPIKSRALIENIITYDRPVPWAEEKKRLEKASIITPESYAAVRNYLLSLQVTFEDDPKAKIAAMERELVGRKIPGYFPTPTALVDRMLDQLSTIFPGARVLEPSAGKGNIAERIRVLQPEADIFVIEQQVELQKILTAKGFELVGSDFTMYQTDNHFDYIVMNPPFEQSQDAEHVIKAHDLLLPGGELVAIVSEGILWRDDRKAKDFQLFLHNAEATIEDIDPGAFKESGTMTASKLVVIRKPRDG